MDAPAYAENIIATVREPLIVLDDQLRVISANAAFFRIFQVSEKNTIGQFIFDLGNQQWDIPKLRQLLNDVLSQNKVFNDYEVTHDFEDIGTKVMLLNAREINIKEIHTHRILLAIEDITERRKLEKIREDFIGLVSHELRSPISTLMLGIDNLQSGIGGPLAKNQAETLELCRRNATQLARTIDNMLVLARLQHADSSLERKRIDLGKLIHSVIQSLHQEVHKVAIIEKIDATLPPVIANPAMITEVLTNLLTNATRYVRKKVTVTASALEHTVTFSISNDGPTIPQEKMNTIFEMFTQLDRDQRREVYKGTGLGLAVCKAIVEHHHGKIWAENLRKAGVVFHVTLPR